MQLHQLQPRHPGRSPNARVGRGGKRGTTSGRGTKGQKSRAGHRIRPAERDYIQQLPKLRGFKNKPSSEKAHVISLALVNARMKGDVVNPITLRDAHIIRKIARIKILGEGEISRPLTFEKVEVSKSAKAKIEAAGGTVKSR